MLHNGYIGLDWWVHDKSMNCVDVVRNKVVKSINRKLQVKIKFF